MSTSCAYGAYIQYIDLADVYNRQQCLIGSVFFARVHLYINNVPLAIVMPKQQKN